MSVQEESMTSSLSSEEILRILSSIIQSDLRQTELEGEEGEITFNDSVFSVPEARKKVLPAWIRAGLERANKGKTEKDETEVEKSKEVVPPQPTNRNKISGYSVLNDSASSGDNKVSSDSFKQTV